MEEACWLGPPGRKEMPTVLFHGFLSEKKTTTKKKTPRRLTSVEPRQEEGGRGGGEETAAIQLVATLSHVVVGDFNTTSRE